MKDETRRPSRAAAQACGHWLKTCLDLGWRKSDLDRLEELWWKYRDDHGNLITSTTEPR